MAEVKQARTGNKLFSVYDLKGVDESPPATLHEAAERGLTAAISRMVERSIDMNINEKDKLQRTALHWAAEMGHIEAAQALLEYGSDLAATECFGRTAIHLAARSGDETMLTMLLSGLAADAKEKLVNQVDTNGITPVFLALQKGDDGRKAFEVLMSNGGHYSEMGSRKSKGDTAGAEPAPAT